MALLSSMCEAAQFVPAELICPSVLLACHMSDLQADVVACGPRGDVLQEVAQRLGRREELVRACFCTGVIAGRRQAEFPVLGSEAMLGHHRQGELRERFKARDVCLSWLRQLGVVPADLRHGPLLSKPAELGRGAYPASYADGIAVCSRVSCGHAVEDRGLPKGDNARVAEA